MTSKKAQELKKYAELDSDEVSETCLLLIQLSNYDYVLTDKMQILLEKEISSKLKWYKENTEIVEREEEFTEKRKYKELVYI